MSATDRQRHLLDAALKVFSRKGFNGATTKEIAVAAGVTEAVIFQHFPSKEALYNAVLHLNLDAWETGEDAEAIRKCMERGDDEGILRVFIRSILNRYRMDTAFFRVILFAALEGHEQGLNRFQERLAPVFKQFKEYIEKRQRDGKLADGDPLAIMMSIGGAAHHYGMVTSIMNAVGGDIMDAAVTEQFTRILLEGIMKRPPARQDY
ncbi:MAG: TetR/AcrR family transcriptional regulator [Acidobacteriota bacterium]|nr:TetR/AcrR family transcriptional regulator [Acidobacteriota bacterium]